MSIKDTNLVVGRCTLNNEILYSKSCHENEGATCPHWIAPRTVKYGGGLNKFPLCALAKEDVEVGRMGITEYKRRRYELYMLSGQQAAYRKYGTACLTCDNLLNKNSQCKSPLCKDYGLQWKFDEAGNMLRGEVLPIAAELTENEKEVDRILKGVREGKLCTYCGKSNLDTGKCSNPLCESYRK